MKRYLLTAALTICSIAAFGQGKSISREKKILLPYVSQKGDTLNVGDAVMLTEGTGTNGQFMYVQLLNGFNEPIKPADSRLASQRQNILFFKEQDGVTYLFTKFFVANIEAAFNKGEIKRVITK
ncbi:hypothetical protein GCM10027422_34310 [Hymenobacter arcticus]